MGKPPVERTKLFREGWQLLSSAEKEDVLSTIEFFLENQNTPSLRNHSLREKDTNIRSISVNDDLRIIIRIRPNGALLLIDIGDHQRVYGQK